MRVAVASGKGGIAAGLRRPTFGGAPLFVERSAMQFPVDLAVAQTARDVPSGAYAYEPKFDGWRSAVHVARGRLQSRNGTDLTRRFPEIASAATALDEDVVLDGELVAVLSDGAAHRLDFAALQAGPQRRRNRGVSVYFLVFDLIAQHGTGFR